MRTVMLAVAMVAAVGCAPGSVSGSVGGVTMNVADAVFAVLKSDAGKSEGLLVILADKPNICTSLKANREPKSATALTMMLYRVTQTDILAPDVGDYTVIDSNPTSAGNYAGASFTRTDANCTNSLSASASSGKSGLIKVTGLKAEANGNATGSFDITFGAGDKVTGNFNAAFCDAVLTDKQPNCE